jgi:hypothetical protein
MLHIEYMQLVHTILCLNRLPGSMARSPSLRSHRMKITARTTEPQTRPMMVAESHGYVFPDPNCRARRNMTAGGTKRQTRYATKSVYVSFIFPPILTPNEVELRQDLAQMLQRKRFLLRDLRKSQERQNRSSQASNREIDIKTPPPRDMLRERASNQWPTHNSHLRHSNQYTDVHWALLPRHTRSDDGQGAV